MAGSGENMKLGMRELVRTGSEVNRRKGKWREDGKGEPEASIEVRKDQELRVGSVY